MPLRVQNDPPWSQKNVENWYIFSKQNFLRFVPLAEKVHFWQGCRTVFAIKLKNFRSNPETVDELKKNLTPVVFPRKDPLATRGKFCKPCLRIFSRKWSWINQKTKKTNKICTIFTKKKQKNVAWTRKNIFDNCDKVFRQEFKSFFIQSPKMVEQF